MSSWSSVRRLLIASASDVAAASIVPPTSATSYVSSRSSSSESKVARAERMAAFFAEWLVRSARTSSAVRF